MAVISAAVGGTMVVIIIIIIIIWVIAKRRRGRVGAPEQGGASYFIHYVIAYKAVWAVAVLKWRYIFSGAHA